MVGVRGGVVREYGSTRDTRPHFSGGEMNWKAACRKSPKNEAEAPFNSGLVIVIRRDGEANLFKRYEQTGSGATRHIRRATSGEIERIGDGWVPAK